MSMKKNIEYIQFLKEDLKDLASLNKNLERSYRLCTKIGIKDKYSDEEFDIFENLATRFSQVLNFILNRIFRDIDKIELENEGLLLEILERACKRGIIEEIDEVKDMKILNDELSQEYLIKNLETLYKEALIYTPKLLDYTAIIKNYCKVKKY